jgi:hypothetical protein
VPEKTIKPLRVACGAIGTDGSERVARHDSVSRDGRKIVDAGEVA